MRRRIRSVLAFALATSFALVALAHPAAGQAIRNGTRYRTADVTFTKWITTMPADPSTLAGVAMAGVVDGDVGSGAFVGLVIRDDTESEPGYWLGQAIYGFNGSTHSFVAYNFVTENDTTTPITATIRGEVVHGWMQGARVTGGYTQFDECPIPTPSNVIGSVCFQGSLHLRLTT
jgi:hypothetical protein